jgi:hypothetical protein
MACDVRDAIESAELTAVDIQTDPVAVEDRNRSLRIGLERLADPI